MRKLFFTIATLLFFPGCLTQYPMLDTSESQKIKKPTTEIFIKIIRQPGKAYIFLKKPKGEKLSDEELKKINKELEKMNEADKNLLKRYLELKNPTVTKPRKKSLPMPILLPL
jgi:hypothetical protein